MTVSFVEKILPTFSLVEDYKINSLFQIFYNYWHVFSGVFEEYTPHQINFITAEFDIILTKYWYRKKWNIEYLKTICYALSVNLAYINPSLFLDKKPSTLNILKGGYIKSNTFIFFRKSNGTFLRKNL